MSFGNTRIQQQYEAHVYCNAQRHNGTAATALHRGTIQYSGTIGIAGSVDEVGRSPLHFTVLRCTVGQQ